jgi:phenylpyruvate tautomerase PptA (4-oxalocrotonate tautomerase family)
MPCLQVSTNVALTPAQRQEAATALSSIVGSATGKPEGYVQVVVEDSVAIYFGGSADPAVFLDLRSIGSISRSQNKGTSAAITKFWSDKYGVSASRIYTSFQDSKGENWGYDGDTFG